MLEEMQVLNTSLADVKLLRPTVHRDRRGWLTESFKGAAFREAGLPEQFVQENHSLSVRGVLRGMHYQLGEPQGKLVRVLSGHIWDAVIDLRRDSPDFGKWAGLELRAGGAEVPLEMLWVPEGFAHGFLVLSERAEVLYKTTRAYFPAGERRLRWDDPDVGIAWPLDQLGMEPLVSGKDACGQSFREAELP